MEVTPSIGRIVHYFPSEKDEKDKVCHKNGAVEHAGAMITKVNNEKGDVNLSISPDNALPEPRLNVKHKSDAQLGQNEPYWDWTTKV